MGGRRKANDLLSSMLNKVEFLGAVAGHRIVDIELRARDSLGCPPAQGEVIVEAFVLDDGSRIVLTASAQIDYDDVWAKVEPGTHG